MSRFENVRAALANLSPAELLKRAPMACRAAVVAGVTVLALRAGGVPVTDQVRDELLAKCASGAHVEIELDMLAYEQETGVANRNYVRIRDGALMAMGRSGARNPFLRDHEQRDVMARAGTIISSATEKIDDGKYEIKQTARITAPWAVDLALRGLLDTVSIGWRPTGPVMCSACNATIFSVCYHFPGDRLAEVDAEGGGKRKVRKADGPITVEWIFTEAELIETSVVSVPAVPGAHIEGIRAALASGLGVEGGEQPYEDEISMKKLAGLAALLGLAATAGEDEVITAAENKIDALTAKVGVLEADCATLTAANDVYEAAKKKTASDKFISDAVTSGRITLGDEELWRKLYKADEADAIATMAKRKVGSAMPVVVPRLAHVEPVDPGAPGSDLGGAKQVFAANGVDLDQSLKFAKMFGAKDPEKTINSELGLGKGA